jgi:hypothetical protein
VQFKLDGANLGAGVTASPYSITWNSTTATSGTHTLTAVARDAAGNTGTAAIITVTVLSSLDNWRLQYFGTTSSTGSAAETFDASGDGETNLMKFATGQNPNAHTPHPGVLVLSGTNLEYTYTRSDAAMTYGLTFAVQWSDTLQAGSWSTSGVSETIESDNLTVQTVEAILPAGLGPRRFVRLQATDPSSL